MKPNEFEKAWAKYIETLRRLDNCQGRKDRARYGCRIARDNLRKLCVKIGVEIPSCAR